MIGYLEGSIQDITENELILRVGDVGYAIHCPTNILQAAQLGQTKALYIHTHIHIDVRDARKTRFLLYGFHTPEDKKWFLHLASVQGIGIQRSLNILGQMTVETLARAIENDDWKTLKQAEGVGPKLAKDLVTALRNKPPRATAPQKPKAPGKSRGKTGGETGIEAATEAVPVTGLEARARQALKKFDLKPKEIESALSAALQESGHENWTEETLIEAALKKLDKNP